MATAIFGTPLGQIILEGTKNGLTSLRFSDFEKQLDTFIPEELQVEVTQLETYFSDPSHRFSLKLDPKGTVFQRKVWNAVNEIPWGRQVSYLDLATAIGNPKSVRAVAAALAKNPLLIIIPCPRIIGSNGSLRGYAGGIWRKKRLLEHEETIVQTALF